MKISINGREVIIKEVPTHVPGLLFAPQMENYSNDDDWCDFTKGHPTETTPKSLEMVRHVLKYLPRNILEIGVCNNGAESFTHVLLERKSPTGKYLGVDLKDKSFLNDPKKGIFTIQANSHDQVAVRSYMKEIGMDELDVLFIDGWHSVNTIINDWSYTDLLTEVGVVFIHDTNSHPGPSVLLHSIDPAQYVVQKYFEDDDDFGLTCIYRGGVWF